MAISLSDALQITEDAQRPFSISYVSFDKTRKKGGEIIHLSNAARVGASHNMKWNDTISVKQLGNDHHPHAVHIHLITEINGQEIFL